jgi:hypothetical protein
MPFDGVGFTGNEYSQQIDAVIDLLDVPERWTKGSFRTPDGRYCLRGAIRTVDKNELLGPTILEAIRQITGKNYYNIERFNDSYWTDHPMVLTVLAKARGNVAAGRVSMPSTTAIRVSRFRRSWNRITASFHLSI